ncbi:CsbD family protein [Sphingomonas sp. MMS24-J45]|uniref:CsbD family protein n=1 Tax=Sphingomonas sp. MMS24-J45 TaxID=3238806 RepID=UPI00384CD803
MNSTGIKGEAQDLGGSMKQAAGDALGNRRLQGEGMADQVTGGVNKAIGAAQDALAAGPGPILDQARSFAREKPWATAALVGTLGLALYNTLRGKR